MFGIINCIFTVMSFANKFMMQFAQEYANHGGRGYYGGEGFYGFLSDSRVFENSVPIEMMDKYLIMITNQAFRDQSLAVQQKRDEYLNNLGQIKRFSSYRYAQSVNCINNIMYNKNKGKLYCSIHTFTPYMKEIKGNKRKMIRCEGININIDFEMAKDFIILAKVKANWFRGSYSEELRWIDNKAITPDSITHAMSMALAPIILGICQMPKGFVTMVEIMTQDQKLVEEFKQENPETPLNLFDSYMQMKERSPPVNPEPPQDFLDPMSDYPDDDSDYLYSWKQKVEERSLESNFFHPYWRGYRRNHRRSNDEKFQQHILPHYRPIERIKIYPL